MHIPWEMILAFGIGLGVMGLVGYLLLVPMRFVWRMVAGAILGAIALFVINFFSAFIGFSVAINPFTALVVGLLGLPGAILVIALTLFL